ncbi:hypothetical protein [Dysgonomonas sp. 25]|uniref:hypothetical protein n=1 Tax=Dysgonomonas sp. 25 TaxID=2302933 RepID=UPI0013D4FD0A|nr:hypothetical protein [Dysgonomonas sp. 25]NDV70072.1 hypothetical protein [Dysgonomonas sp. 25]
MKNKIKLYSGLMAGVLLFSVLVYACTKEEIATEPQQPVEALTIENAQKWYNQHFGSVAKTKASSDAGDDDGITLIPQWNEAELSADSMWYTVESPLESSSDIRVLFMQEEVLNHAIENKAYQQVKQVHRHVVMRNRETGETYAFIMVVMPTLEYMQRVGDALETNKYLSRESDLDGEVVYFNCAGEFVNGWIYEKGKITYGTHVEEFGGNRKKAFISVPVTRCWTQEALIAGSDGIFDVVDEMIRCEEYMEWINVQPDRWETNRPGEGGGGGGIYVGGGVISPPKVKPSAKITKKISLDAAGIKELDNTLEEKLKQCGYKSMYDYLVNKGSKLSNIKIDPSGSYGGYNPENGEMTFKDNGSIQTAFPEEFIHFFQDNYYPNGLSYSNNVGRSNIEFEAKLIQDILCYIKAEGCFYYSRGSQYINEFDYWLMNITKEGTYIPKYSDLLKRDPSWGNLNYWDFLDDFRRSKPDYNFPVDKNLLPAAMNFLNSTGCY